jgi:hypothetical protein
MTIFLYFLVSKHMKSKDIQMQDMLGDQESNSQSKLPTRRGARACNDPWGHDMIWYGPWGILGPKLGSYRGANTFPLRNRLPYPFSLVARPFPFQVSLSVSFPYLGKLSVWAQFLQSWPLKCQMKFIWTWMRHFQPFPIIKSLIKCTVDHSWLC